MIILQHIKTLVLSFQQIALSTPLDHYEYKHVKFVIESKLTLTELSVAILILFLILSAQICVQPNQ